MSRRFAFLVLMLALGAAGACADARPTAVDARPGDADGDAGAGADAAGDGDAGETPPRPGAEVVSASGRVRSGTITMDVEVGHAFDQTTTTAGTRTLRGAAVVIP